MSRASWNVLAQIPAYTANAHNEQRRERRVYGTDYGEQVEASKVVGKTLLAYVTEAGYDPVGIVIEKNMEIIHREDFDKVNIADEDVIEILHFVGGGQF